MKRSVYDYAFLSLGLAAVLFLATDIAGFKFDAEKVTATDVSVEFAADDSADFFGKDWKLLKIEGKAAETDKAFIKFDQKNGSMGGSGSCNFIGAKFAKNANEIKFTDISTTVMACRKGMADEYNFLENLKRVNEYKIEDGKLLLLENDVVVLEFESK